MNTKYTKSLFTEGRENRGSRREQVLIRSESRGLNAKSKLTFVAEVPDKRMILRQLLLCAHDAICRVKRLIPDAFAAFWVVLCCLGAGCASSGRITDSGGVAVSGGSSLADYETATVEVVSERENSEEQRTLLQALVITGLQQSDKFKRVSGSATTGPNPSELKVKARIKSLYKVSDGARVMVGALAGRASIVADVELTDTDKGTALAAFQASGKSSGGWAGAGTTDQAVQKVAETIVAEIVKRR